VWEEGGVPDEERFFSGFGVIEERANIIDAFA